MKKEVSEEILAKFKSLKTERDVAELLGIKYGSLYYFLRVQPSAGRYTQFKIPKKSGGVRDICAPVPELKSIQRKLNQILQKFYEPRICAHGFINKRSILSNAKIHVQRLHVANIDLKDFFPSIHFGRIRGLFLSYPFNFNKQVATMLAQLCCNDYLPQGAPTSPTLSNFICLKLDGVLLSLAHKNKCFYTRYADDLTFSTSQQKFPKEIMEVKADGLHLSQELQDIIVSNGFQINFKKVRISDREGRQDVTGLTVNEKPNIRRSFIRNTRAMLNDWLKHGYESAERKFLENYSLKYRNPELPSPSLKNVAYGRLNFIRMIRGEEDGLYLKLARKLKKLYPDSNIRLKEDKLLPLIITEGTSDRMHLKAALRSFQQKGDFFHLDVNFSEYHETMGDKLLIAMCREKACVPQPVKTIFMFDRDNAKTVAQVNDRNGAPKYWGNNVFSFAIPTPSHRTSTPNISIELYYKDDELMRKDSKGRRLFLSNEFSFPNNKHHREEVWYSGQMTIRHYQSLFVLDDEVMTVMGQNVALPKNDFAHNVLEQEENFHDFNYSEFANIFSTIEGIIKLNSFNLS